MKNFCSYEFIWPNGMPRRIFVCPENENLSDCSYFKGWTSNSDCAHRREDLYDDTHRCISGEAQEDSVNSYAVDMKLEDL